MLGKGKRGAMENTYEPDKDRPKDASLSSHVICWLIGELDEHLASLSMLFHQYLKHTWLSAHLPEEAKQVVALGRVEVLAHMSQLADIIVELGGVPVSSPIEQCNLAYLDHEVEGTFPWRAMLTLDLEHEKHLAWHTSCTLVAAHHLRTEHTKSGLKNVADASQTRAERIEQVLQRRYD